MSLSSVQPQVLYTLKNDQLFKCELVDACPEKGLVLQVRKGDWTGKVCRVEEYQEKPDFIIYQLVEEVNTNLDDVLEVISFLPIPDMLRMALGCLTLKSLKKRHYDLHAKELTLFFWLLEKEASIKAE